MPLTPLNFPMGFDSSNYAGWENSDTPASPRVKRASAFNYTATLDPDFVGWLKQFKNFQDEDINNLSSDQFQLQGLQNEWKKSKPNGVGAGTLGVGGANYSLQSILGGGDFPSVGPGGFGSPDPMNSTEYTW